jgi:hypothetical protein
MINAFDVADEIANEFELIGIVIRDFHTNEMIFDKYHQLDAVEPVGPEIVSKVRFIRDPLDIDIQVVGNESADRDFKAFFNCHSLLSGQAIEGHDEPLIREHPGILSSNPPTIMTIA